MSTKNPRSSMTSVDAGFIENMQRRLSEVESLLTFLQRTVDDLNGVILQQQRRLDAQEKELARLRATVTNVADSIAEAPRKPEDEKPPHY